MTLHGESCCCQRLTKNRYLIVTCFFLFLEDVDNKRSNRVG